MSNENKRPEVASPSENVVAAKTEMQDLSEPPSKRVKLEESTVDSTTIQQVKLEPTTTTTTTTTTPTSSVPASVPGTRTENSIPITTDGPLKHDVPSQHRIGKETPPPPSVTVLQATSTHTGTGSSPIVTPNPAPPQQVNNESATSSVALAPVKKEPLVVTVADPEAKTKSTTATVATTVKAPPPTGSSPPGKTAPGKSASEKEVPLKSTTMLHLKTKYTAELEYMLREFRKLERQLLGAKGAAQLEESAGSRERREKLHSFILHLEDTIRQIETGCALEAEGKSTIVNRDTDAPSQTADSDEAAKKQMAESSALTNLTKEKEEEENVQKLEEHILANLLPVKVRLKKQLAAQQGASRNPAGMPAPRRGSLQPSATARGQGTFAEAAEKRRKQAEAARLAAQEEKEQTVRRVSDATQFGKPLGGGGSSLTQKLHGPTLGSTKRPHGHGVGSSEKSEVGVGQQEVTIEKKILYAGMVPGSTQHKSGVLAASGVHEMKIENSQLQKEFSEQKPPAIAPAPAPTPTQNQSSAPTQTVSQVKVKVESLGGQHTTKAALPTQKSKPQSSPRVPPAAVTKTSAMAAAAAVSDDANLTDAEKRKLRKKRRKKKLLRLKKRREKERHRQATLHQQAQASQLPTKGATGKRKAVVGKGQGKKKGPRSVEYICALCSEAYTSTCDYNPWWALAQHECPKCRKTQIPRIDITSPANAIEYHPALLAHADENGGGGAAAAANAAAAAANIVHVEQAPTISTPLSRQLTNLSSEPAPLSDSESELSELSDDSLSACSSDSEGSVADLQSMTAAERAEHESFGHDYKGPFLSDDHAGRLLILMSHASTCPCRHKSQKQRDVCISTKYMMLHVRDCPGTTSTFDVCPYPWCRKVKHLLYHLVSCADPDGCSICNPKELSQNMQGLVGLNQFRVQKYRERLVAAAKAASSTSSRVVPVPPVSNVSTLPVQSTTAAIHPPPQKIPGTSKSKTTKQKSAGTAKRSKPTVKHRTTASSKNTPKASTVIIKPKQSQATRPVTTTPVTVVTASQRPVTTPRISNTAPQTTVTTPAARTVQVKQQQVVKPAVTKPSPVVNAKPTVANTTVAASVPAPASAAPYSAPASVPPRASVSPPSTTAPTLKVEPVVKVEPVITPTVAVACRANPVTAPEAPVVTAVNTQPVAPVPVVAKPPQIANTESASPTTQFASGNLASAQGTPTVHAHNKVVAAVKIEPPMKAPSVVANEPQANPTVTGPGPVVAASGVETPKQRAVVTNEASVQGQATVNTHLHASSEISATTHVAPSSVAQIQTVQTNQAETVVGTTQRPQLPTKTMAPNQVQTPVPNQAQISVAEQTMPAKKTTFNHAHVPPSSVPTANVLVHHQNQTAKATESFPAATATTSCVQTTDSEASAASQTTTSTLPSPEAQNSTIQASTSQPQTAPAASSTVPAATLNSSVEPSARNQTNTNGVNVMQDSPLVVGDTTIVAPSAKVEDTNQAENAASSLSGKKSVENTSRQSLEIASHSEVSKSEVTASSQPASAGSGIAAITPAQSLATSPTSTDQPLVAAAPIASVNNRDVRVRKDTPVANVPTVSITAKEEPTSSNPLATNQINPKIPSKVVNTNPTVPLHPDPTMERSSAGRLGASGSSVELEATRGGAPPHNHTEVGKAAEIVKVN